MRKKILTEKERQIIAKYLETGERLENFSCLLSRCKHMQPINEDLQLIEQFLKKTEGGR
jgi:hypothetical protein